MYEMLGTGKEGELTLQFTKAGVLCKDWVGKPPNPSPFAAHKCQRRRQCQCHINDHSARRLPFHGHSVQPVN